MAYGIIPLVLSGVSIAISGGAIILSYRGVIRPRIEEIKTGYERQLDSYSHTIETIKRESDWSEEQIMREAKTTDRDGSPRPLGEVYSEIKESYNQWSRLPFWEKAKRVLQQPQMHGPRAQVTVIHEQE